MPSASLLPRLPGCVIPPCVLCVVPKGLHPVPLKVKVKERGRLVTACAGLGQGLGIELASLVAQMVKTLPAMPDSWVPSLGREDPLEEEMATHSSIFAWRIPWTQEPGGLQSMGSQRVGQD